MIISTKDFDKLVFNQRMGFECPTIQVQAALLLSGSDMPNTKGLNGKLLIFRHLKATVEHDAKHVRMFRKNFVGRGLLVSFSPHEEENRDIIDHVVSRYYDEDAENLVMYSALRKYRHGWLGLVDAPRRSHVEKIL